MATQPTKPLALFFGSDLQNPQLVKTWFWPKNDPQPHYEDRDGQHKQYKKCPRGAQAAGLGATQGYRALSLFFLRAVLDNPQPANNGQAWSLTSQETSAVVTLYNGLKSENDIREREWATRVFEHDKDGVPIIGRIIEVGKRGQLLVAKLVPHGLSAEDIQILWGKDEKDITNNPEKKVDQLAEKIASKYFPDQRATDLPDSDPPAAHVPLPNRIQPATASDQKAGKKVTLEDSHQHRQPVAGKPQKGNPDSEHMSKSEFALIMVCAPDEASHRMKSVLARSYRSCRALERHDVCERIAGLVDEEIERVRGDDALESFLKPAVCVRMESILTEFTLRFMKSVDTDPLQLLSSVIDEWTPDLDSWSKKAK